VYGNQELENDLTYINDYDFSVERIFYEKGNWYAILSKNEY